MNEKLAERLEHMEQKLDSTLRLLEQAEEVFEYERRLQEHIWVALIKRQPQHPHFGPRGAGVRVSIIWASGKLDAEISAHEEVYTANQRGAGVVHYELVEVLPLRAWLDRKGSNA